MTTPSKLSLFSPAKINLFLHITSKRADGYHNLQTIFRLLDWGDDIDFERTERTFDPHRDIDDSNLPIRLHSNIAVTSSPTDNLITKAAVALINHSKTAVAATDASADTSLAIHLPVVEVRLHKRLPTGAGLGGGSSNAATALVALNQLWGFDLDKQTLIDIGATVGADVPIFIFAQDAIAEGIGEQLTSIELPQQHYLLLNPDAHASTQALFAHPQLRRDNPTLSQQQLVTAQQSYLNELTEPFSNVFEPVVTDLVPEVADALTYLKGLEPMTGTSARMTGSGSSVFLPIPVQKLEQIKDYVANKHPAPCHAIVTQSLNLKKHHKHKTNN